MVLVANIIKVSSVSLGNMSLGTTSSFKSLPPSAAAYSGHKITRVESPQSARRSQKKPQEPPAAAENDHQSKQAKVIPRALTTVTTPSFVHVKTDHRVLTEDVNDRADDFIRRKRQIINDDVNMHF